MLEIKPKKEGDIEAAARFRFESGPLAGSDYIGTTSVCDLASCPCELVHFKLAPSEGTNPEVSFALEVRSRKVDDLGNAGGKALSFARHMARSLTEKEWLDLLTVYTKAKEEITETADIQKIPLYFIDDGDGSVYWYRDFLPHAAPFRFSVGGKRVDAFDSYCINPKCSCTEVFLTFVLPEADYRRQNQADYSTVRLSYQDPNLVNIVNEPKQVLAQPQAVIDAMVQDIPEIWQKVRKRHDNIKALFGRYIAENQAPDDPVSANKVGRNDPCPCGSGKKFKKCCMNS